jgi:hypothetical protein
VFQNTADIYAGRIVAKKDNLLHEYKTTRAGVNTTGAGKDEGDATLEEILRKKCRWYFEMEEVVGDKPNAGPPAQALDTGVFDPALLGGQSEDFSRSRSF